MKKPETEAIALPASGAGFQLIAIFSERFRLL